MSEPRLTVGDTGGLISLALPLVSPSYDHEDGVEPFGLFLTNYDVTVPDDVYRELDGLATEEDSTLLGNDEPPTEPTESDLTASAAKIVAEAEGAGYDVSDPYRNSAGHDEPPSWGLDGGETAAIVQANHLDADGMLSDDFKSKAKIVTHLDDGVEWLSSFDLLVEMKENGLLSLEDGRELAETMIRARNWENQPYVQRIVLKRL